MISDGEGFVLRHRSGRYLQSDIFYPGFKAGQHDPNVRIAYIYQLVPNPFAATIIYQQDTVRRFLETADWRAVADQFEIMAGPGCKVCGERGGNMWGDHGTYRCDKHKDRNPCAIEGCRRTTAAKGHLRNDQYLCTEHWRRFVPPRSRTRRIYHAYFRKAKRYGWNDDLTARFWRFWDRIISRAREGAQEGHLDEAEINRLMGWE